jgi:hypothetical protein
VQKIRLTHQQGHNIYFCKIIPFRRTPSWILTPYFFKFDFYKINFYVSTRSVQKIRFIRQQTQPLKWFFLHFYGRHIEFCRHFAFLSIFLGNSSFIFQLKVCQKPESYIQKHDHLFYRSEISSFRSIIHRVPVSGNIMKLRRTGSRSCTYVIEHSPK